MKNQAEANSATAVVEEMLQCSKVRLPGIMHVKTDLLNGIGEIRPGEIGRASCRERVYLCV